MRIPGHALRAVGLLVGFYALAVGVLAAVAVLDVELVLHTRGNSPVFSEAKLIGGTVVIAIPLVRGLVLTRRRGGGPRGIAVTEQEQPELWARVRGLAERVGTRPPREIRLVGMVNAAVDEDVRLMGLLARRRRMYLGVPLLIGLSSAEFDAVIAHELGHYSNRDVRLGSTIMRGQVGVLAVAEASPATRSFPLGLAHSFFTWYAELYLRTSQSVRRRQEFAADQLAARIAGRDNTIAALRQLPALDGAYHFYLDRYAGIGWDAGVLPRPEEFFAGLHALLTEPGRQAELDEIRRDPPTEETSPYDSHPPIEERIAALNSRPDAYPGAAATAPAISLLRDAPRVLAAVAATTLPPEAANMRTVGWDELARQAGRRNLVEAGGLVLRTASTVVALPVPDLPALLAVLDAGWLDHIAGALPKSPRAQQATGPVAREFARTALRDALAPLALLALVDAGLAGWAHDWARPLHLWFAADVEDHLDAALDAVVAQLPDTRPLRRLLYQRPQAPVPAPDKVRM